jgi:MATE family, multidrug efflux pump
VVSYDSFIEFVLSIEELMKDLLIGDCEEHPFEKQPNKTFILLSIPVLFSMVAEPVTGLVDTAFIARLGSIHLAALGVGTMILSSVFWVFGFLGIGSQTEVAQSLGKKEKNRAAEIGYLALLVGFILGVLLILILWVSLPSIIEYMGATGEVYSLAASYTKIRLLGAPAILMTIAAFGILRGMQNMRIPLWTAVFINLMNILLDAVLIFGLGPFPVMGIAGAAIATVVSQWLGAVVLMMIILRKLEKPERLKLSDIRRLFKIGGDLFIRTGLLLFYLLMATRAATRISVEAGAAHQAIRQFWIFTALFLDAFSVTAQSLIAYFMGQGKVDESKKVARVICVWTVLTGCLLTVVMLGGEKIFIKFLVPPESIPVFTIAWAIAAWSQPLNAIAFATDGIHWGTGDFSYLRNGMIFATSIGLLGIYYLEISGSMNLTTIWSVTVIWILARSLAGFIRVWPGIGRSPLNTG